jgi:hypothetical protein
VRQIVVYHSDWLERLSLVSAAALKVTGINSPSGLEQDVSLAVC